jgi:hypothetical protein
MTALKRFLTWTTVFAACCAALTDTQAQALPIAIDGRFDDWTAAKDFTDDTNDGSLVDFLSCSVSNDDRYLFIRLQIREELQLTANNALVFYLDTDGNPLTGEAFNGIGAELVLYTGEREASFFGSGFPTYLSLNDIGYRQLPTISSSDFEIAIERDRLVNGVPVFSGNQVNIAFRDKSTFDGDWMPNAGETFSYVFDESQVPAYQPVTLEKSKPEHLRLLAYNTENNGLTDPSRQDNFIRILKAIQPDIVMFNECWDVSANEVSNFMNSTVPLPLGEIWSAEKQDQGNVTASRFPILQSWVVKPDSRLTASLIDLPSFYQRNLLVVNGHLRCCEADYNRQLEADAFVKFILDAKSPGGVITLPEGTPFILGGDLNLVGYRQQLTTLLTGEIVNTSIYGNGGPLDWDGSDLTDAVSLHTDERMAYTWRDDSESFIPARIDYHIYSASKMEAKKAFTLRTESMPPARRALYGLQEFDTRNASDHLPKVTDFELPTSVNADNAEDRSLQLTAYPTPFNQYLTIQFPSIFSEFNRVYLRNGTGRIMKTLHLRNIPAPDFTLDTADLPPGIYWVEIRTDRRVYFLKCLKS